MSADDRRTLDLILSRLEDIMSALTDLQAAYGTLHQTILDDIAAENALLAKIADANAANDSPAIVDLLRQARADNDALQGQITKAKAAVDAAPAAPAADAGSGTG